MESTIKYTMRIMRELLAKWKTGSTPALILAATIYGFELYLEQHLDWESDVVEYEEGTDTAV